MAVTPHIVVPIAGPDYASSEHGIKGLELYNGQPILQKILKKRSWFSPEAQLSFVAADTPTMRAFAEQHLQKWFPRSAVIFLGDYAQGAALSALAGAGLVQNLSSPLIIDLADIDFISEENSFEMFEKSPDLGAVAMCFKSADPCYSYLLFKDGVFQQAAEKVVISDIASAGVYMFRNTAVYLRALAHSLDNFDELSCNGLAFVCPTLNGVVSQGYDVRSVQVRDFFDVKQKK